MQDQWKFPCYMSRSYHTLLTLDEFIHTLHLCKYCNSSFYILIFHPGTIPETDSTHNGYCPLKNRRAPFQILNELCYWGTPPQTDIFLRSCWSVGKGCFFSVKLTQFNWHYVLLTWFHTLVLKHHRIIEYEGGNHSGVLTVQTCTHDTQKTKCFVLKHHEKLQST